MPPHFQRPGKTGHSGIIRRFWRELAPRLSAYFKGLLPAFMVDFDSGRSIVWYVLLFCAGIIVYFDLPSEPSFFFLVAAAVISSLIVFVGYRNGLEFRFLLIPLLLVLGMSVGSLRTELIAAPIFEKPRTITVTGFVESVENSGNRSRVQVRVAEMSGIGRDNWPRHVRLTFRGKDSPVAIGEGIQAKARLMAPQGAVVPGGYDYSFRMFFEGVGATGYSFGQPQRILLGAPPLDLRVAAAIDTFRKKIADRIIAHLGDGREGALAVALLVGDRSWLDDETEEALRGAGLAHVLAISGLHMALFAGAVFFALRAGLALIPRVALHHPIDRWAALAALIAATFYLVISGASIATQRAFVMMALILAGRVLGRRALTYRSVSLAALFILVTTPEALLQPGFQMSFAAVIVLIAAYEEVTRRRASQIPSADKQRSFLKRFTGRILIGLAALALTSIVAGTATGVIGAYHFQRVAPLGFFVNIVAMPIVTLVIMPFGVLSLALIPLGFEGLTLPIMGLGLDAMVRISLAATQLTPGEGIIGAQSASGTLLIVAAGLVLCLFPTGYRRLSVVPMAMGVAALLLIHPPDLYVAADGKNIAFRDNTGTLYTTARRRNFESEVWLRSEGIAKEDFRSHQAGGDLKPCDDDACLIMAFAGIDQASTEISPAFKPLVISLISKPGAFEEDCHRADVIVTPLALASSCAKALVIDQQMLGRTGALAIKLTRLQSSTIIQEIIPASMGNRPWSGRVHQ